MILPENESDLTVVITGLTPVLFHDKSADTDSTAKKEFTNRVTTTIPIVINDQSVHVECTGVSITIEFENKQLLLQLYNYIQSIQV